jgi:propionyl-CoA carboxylase beta chain
MGWRDGGVALSDATSAVPNAVGRLTARERVDLLLDPGSFVENGSLVTHRCRDFGMAERTVHGDGVITGWGTVGGRVVYVLAQDRRVFGGSLGEQGGHKVCRLFDLALQNGAPVVALYDGGGGRIQEGVDAMAGGTEVFGRHALASGMVPQVSAIMGPCTGVAAYGPALTDFIFMVEGSFMSLTGPGVIRAVTSKNVTNEEIGGAEVHTVRTGLAHFVKESDEACFAGIRDLLAFLPSNYLDPPPPGESSDSPDRRAEELEGLVSASAEQPYDMRLLLRAVVDDGRFLEVQERFARNLIVGFARFANQTVGVVANQPAYLAGALTLDASLKGSRFVRFCDAFNIPVVTFVDCPGYLPSMQEELGGVIKHGAKLGYAYAEATVPLVTVITRKAYGGAYGALGSKHLGGDFNLAYPGAEIAVIGAAGAVEVLYRRELRLAGDRAGELRARVAEEYRRKFSNPFLAVERGYLDAIIRPAETRPQVIRALGCLTNKRLQGPRKRHSNLPL